MRCHLTDPRLRPICGRRVVRGQSPWVSDEPQDGVQILGGSLLSSTSALRPWAGRGLTSGTLLLPPLLFFPQSSLIEV